METLELVAVGDISLAGPEGCDPFEHVARYLQKGDIVFGNMEGVLSDTGVAAEKETTLRAPPARAEYLRRAGFDVVNVANNHILDFGPAGLSQTLRVLRAQGIRVIGAGDRPSQNAHEIIECRGLKVGFLGYCQNDASAISDGVFVNGIDRRAIFEQLHGLQRHCDMVIVSLHWGFELVYYPSPGQIELARDLIAAGAVAVLGHHPHVVQGIEAYEGGLIAYSLGGFQFERFMDGMERSFILRARISPRGVERCKIIPVHIGPDGAPRLAWDEDRRATLGLVERISLPVWEGRVSEPWWFEQMAGAYLRVSLRAWVRRVRKYGPRHLAQFVRWLVSRFTIKCYLGWLRRTVRLHE